ncbi:MAG: hypothetical protein ACXW61_11345, partial [Gemmatirosa sp.]
DLAADMRNGETAHGALASPFCRAVARFRCRVSRLGFADSSQLSASPHPTPPFSTPPFSTPPYPTHAAPARG